MIVCGTYIALLVTAVVSDFLKLRIPNSVCLALLVLFLIPATLNASNMELVERLAAFAAVFLIGWCLFLLGVIGGGDVKLFAATSLWIGLDLLATHAVYVAIFGLVLAMVLMAARSLVLFVADRFNVPQARALPVSLVAGEGVPYGVAIGASAMILIGRYSDSLWVI